MKIGNIIVKSCNDCPAYTWSGESTSRGDCGYRCAFGAFDSSYVKVKQVPPACPFRVLRDAVKESV